MITSKTSKLYCELASRILHKYSPNTIIKANSLMSSDEAVLKMEQILSTNPTEQEFLEKMEKM
jgi:hypothetical protein